MNEEYYFINSPVIVIPILSFPIFLEVCVIIIKNDINKDLIWLTP